MLTMIGWVIFHIICTDSILLLLINDVNFFSLILNQTKGMNDIIIITTNTIIILIIIIIIIIIIEHLQQYLKYHHHLNHLIQ